MNLEFVQKAFSALGEWIAKLVAGWDAIDLSFIQKLFDDLGKFLSGG